MEPDKPTHADNRPTVDPQRQFPREEVPRQDARDPARRLEAESKLQAAAESRPVAGTESQALRDEKAVPASPPSKSRDPSDPAAQLRSATGKKPGQLPA